MGFKEWLIRNNIYAVKRLPTKPEKRPPTIKSRLPDPDELALGWATETDEETEQTVHQLKGVSQEHRSTHFYVVGASGSGKTKFLETLAKQDITNGDGFGVIDPHADLTEDLKGYLYLLKKDDGEFLRERVILIDPTDPLRTVCFNPLERLDNISPAGIASGLVEAFKKIWGSGDRKSVV